MTEPPQPPDPQRCPVCGKVNQCAMELAKKAGIESGIQSGIESGIAQPPCWCTQVTFSASLLASLPPASQGLACLCAVCAESATFSQSLNPTH